ncbi:MAG: bifunctional DNA primase/polymerase, partial [Candidatus Marinimicrobia bacterium]|nr:bifunctional DNA primase/polymerase [Candidatus Neomarinimicrobiota bacterium]
MPQKKAQIPSTLINCVEAYAQAGYATFATTGDKVPPAGSSWRQAKTDAAPNPMKYPYGQFGVKLKADDLIIDLDPRNMKGRKVWSELKTQISMGQDIETSATIVRTGGGGLHIYLRKPPTFNIRKSIKEFPGVDFLSEGAYVIGAGSQVNGKTYTFITPPFAIVDAPGGLLNLVKRPVVDLGKVNHKGFSDSQDNIERFVTYLDKLAPIAIEGEHGDKTTFKVACRGRDYNLSMQKTFDLMAKHYNPKCRPMWEQRELQHKVANAYSYNEAPPGTRDPKVALPDMEAKEDPKKWMVALERNKNDTLRPTLKNAVLLLKHEMGIKGVFIYNAFNERLEVKGHVPWEKNRINRYNAVDDREIECIRLHLAQTHFVEFSSQTMWKAVDLVAAGNVYHPIKDVLETYKWDGISRVDTWLIRYCGGADTALIRQIGRKVLCAMISRIYNPGCKFDYVLVLEGIQGIGKSTTCEILGGEWYGDAPVDPKDKDCIPYIHSKWVIELSEMITSRKTESDRLKNFISRREDDVRLPYARARQRFPRQCIFVGTINPDDVGYLTDTTGNRRFWPVFCHSFDLEGLKRDREQLLAEAIVYHKQGESLMLGHHLIKESEDEAMERLADDPWQWI